MKKHIVCFGDSNTHGYCVVKIYRQVVTSDQGYGMID